MSYKCCETLSEFTEFLLKKNFFTNCLLQINCLQIAPSSDENFQTQATPSIDENHKLAFFNLNFNLNANFLINFNANLYKFN